MFEFENSRLTRDFFNNDNRLTICEQANYSRALKNGEKNIEDILLLEEKIGDVYFTEKTKVLAELRKENKDASYGELAELATKKGLVVTKSGVVHVFTKFSEDASKLK
jgi:DNA-binding protein WhiA